MKNRSLRNGFGLRLMGAFFVTLVLSAATPPESPVADAAMRGETDRVRALLRNGADASAAQGDGMTALHWAADQGAEDMTSVLIYAGANLEATTRLGAFTPLLIASRAGNAGVVGILMEAGADASRRTTTGETALHLAAASGRVEGVSAILAHRPDVDATENARGQTPLMFAAAAGRAEVVEVLLLAGADATIKTRVIDYPTMAIEDRDAAKIRHDRLQALYGEDRVYNTMVDGTAASRLAIARTLSSSSQEDEEEAEELRPDEENAVRHPDAAQPAGIEEERTVPFSYDELVGRQGGNSALHYAAREGRRDAVMALIDGGADVNDVTSGDFTSPLLMATLNGHFDLAVELLERGADPTLRSAPGATPLYATIHMQWVPKSFYPQQTANQQAATTHLELMEALLKAGADPNARLERHLWYTSFNHNVLGVDTWGATPFWRAAWGTDVDAMKLLMEYGADPTIPTLRPPGRVSTGNGADDSEAVEDPSGLPPIPVGGRGVDPIHAASGVGYGLGLAGNAHRHAPNGWLPSVKYFVEELGADVNARDYNGFSPLHNAAARGDVELINYLVEHGADVTVLTRKGETTADMANGPVQRVTVFPAVVALLESLGSKNNHNCISC
jgi:ankyrin repeat protein